MAEVWRDNRENIIYWSYLHIPKSQSLHSQGTQVALASMTARATRMVLSTHVLN